jgi:hypothetical protein
MLDPSKGTREQFLDKWTYKVTKEIPQNNSDTKDSPHKIVCQTRTIFSADSSVEFTKLFSKYVHDYVNRETRVQEVINAQLPFLSAHCHVPEEMVNETTEKPVKEFILKTASDSYDDEKGYDPIPFDDTSESSESDSETSEL